MIYILMFIIFLFLYFLCIKSCENFNTLNIISTVEITDKIDKMYYINMDKRQDRKEHFLKECEKHNLNMNNVIRFKGIDGNITIFTDQEKQMFINSDFKGSTAEFKIMGNQLSHYYILKEMIENNYNYILIFQDDVILSNDFNNQINKLIENIPNDAEIVNFGFHKLALYAYFEAYDINHPVNSLVPCEKIINDSIIILDRNVNPCSLAYLVTYKGARNLVQYFNTVGFHRATDQNYNDYLINNNINYATRKALCTGDPNFGSDIFS